jgi:release factor glutamine methyltransferase
MTIDEWIHEASDELKNAGIDSALLDAELILAHTLRQPRTYLHAHGSEKISSRHEDIANARLELRLERTPVAYIIGHKEFYGRKFKTSPSALIPRPESEALIELLDEILPKNLPLAPVSTRLIDVGTGTGCLGITAKLEWPEITVTLADIDKHALNLARENAKLLHADVTLLQNDLLRGYTDPVDIIIANLPYVNKQWEVSPETHAEPSIALYASDSGLSLIKQLIIQAVQLLPTGGHLLLESDLRQHAAIIALAKESGLRLVQTKGLITHFSKV